MVGYGLEIRQGHRLDIKTMSQFDIVSIGSSIMKRLACPMKITLSTNLNYETYVLFKPRLSKVSLICEQPHYSFDDSSDHLVHNHHLCPDQPEEYLKTVFFSMSKIKQFIF